MFGGVLTQSAAQRIVFNDDDQVDILYSGNYETGKISGNINIFDSFQEAEWFTGTMEGRVTVEIVE